MTEPVSVLVVDDEPAFREGLRQALKQEGFVVHLAADGEEALEVFDAYRPDLVLLDVMLPRMSGIVTTSLLCTREGRTRKLTNSRRTPPVMTSDANSRSNFHNFTGSTLPSQAGGEKTVAPYTFGSVSGHPDPAPLPARK